jgi:N-acetylglucosaminyl-diphospho-decaprenol L-rhamnosyltransferase
MHQGQLVFSQLMRHLPLATFRSCVSRYAGERKVKSFSCLDQYLCVAFARLTYRESLRNIEASLRAQAAKLYHLGIRGNVSRNALANARRDWRIYASFAERLIGIARGLYAEEPFGVDLARTVYALDATTFDLCLPVFAWAPFRSTKAHVKLHTLLDRRGNIPSFIHVSDGKMHDVNLLNLLSLPEAERSRAFRHDCIPLTEFMQEVDVVVIIITYKCAALTVDCLRSVALERSDPSIRIRAIVIDNASGDSASIAQAIETNYWSSWVALITAPKNGGFAYGNNLGIEAAYADGTPSYLYLLNPDAQVRSNAIGSLVRFLDAHPKVGIAGSSFENLDGSDWPLAFRFPSLMSEVLQGIDLGFVSRFFQGSVVARTMSKTPQPTDWICGASMMIRPVVVASIGGMDENYFLYFEETDFCHRAKRAGFPTWYVPESRVMHIMGQSTTVTDTRTGPKRLPAYWFESRRRYFIRTYGLRRAIAIDIAALIANSIGLIKRIARPRNRAVPHYIRDLLRHSVLWPKNRNVPPVRGFRPPRSHI